MRILSAAEVEAALDWESLIERLRQTFRRGAEAPPGHHHDIANPAGAAGRLSLGPAWQSGRHIGLRIATDFPDNPARGLPAAMGAYLLLDGRSGARATRRRSPGPGFSSTAVAGGAFHPEDIAGDLFELTRGERAGRRFYDQITLFKSVGSALGDLAAAQLAVERC